MAKIKIEYNTDNLEDCANYYRATKANDMAAALFEIMYNTKKKLEWEIEGTESTGNELEQYAALDKVYDTLWDLMREYDLNIDKLNQ